MHVILNYAYVFVDHAAAPSVTQIMLIASNDSTVNESELAKV
jgi:hypothetical protein